MGSIGNRKNQHSFAMIPDVRIPRSKFDRSYAVKDTWDFDYLYPIHIDEVIPGDTHNLTVNMFARLATQLVPIMDNMYIDFYFFFVPNRLTWKNWEKFNGAQDNPGDSTSFVVPIMTPAAAFTVGSIFDKMGLPTGVANVPVDNTLPLRAYIKIYNDWFRDQNLQNSIALPVDDGPDVQADFSLQKAAKKHDYFTSALPWPQKGTAVSLPLGSSAEVWGTATALPTAATSNNAPIVGWYMDRATDGGITGRETLHHITGVAPQTSPTYANLSTYAIATAYTGTASGSGNISGTVNSEKVYMDKAASLANRASAVAPFSADLSSATAATVNQLRLAIMVQSLLELDARGGTRYVELLKSHFGVISPDFRLQRAEFLGGGTVNINSHPVAQTAITSGTDALGQLAAFSTASASHRDNIGFTKSFVEHGYVIGLARARADITYQQGLNRMWSKSTRYDFFWPKLQELGEQTILNKEIYCDPAGTPDDVFGYQERYAEYRYKPSEIRGEFRSTYATPLDMWHLAEEFSAQPALNSAFIVGNTPIDRAIAVVTEPHLLVDMWFKNTQARPMMTYSVPATLGRF